MSGSHLLKFTTDLSKTTKMQLLKNPLHEGESKAHTFVAKAVRDGVAVDLTGLPVTAYYNFNNETMPLSECEIVNGEAKVTLSEACYIPCIFDLLVMVGSGDERSCILWVHGAVRDSMNDTVYDPENVVPNLPELMALIDTMRNYDAVKLDANLGSQHAGNLLYVSADGSVQPLTLGTGLQIVDGVLRVTYTPVPDEPDEPETPVEDVVFVQQEDGSILMQGVAFVEQEDGSILWDVAVFTEQTDGSYLIS